MAKIITIIDADVIEESEMVTEMKKERFDRKKLQARKNELQIRRDLDKLEIDEININLAKFK